MSDRYKRTSITFVIRKKRVYVLNHLGRFVSNLPKRYVKSIDQLAEYYQIGLRESLHQKNLIWTGRLGGSTPDDMPSSEAIAMIKDGGLSKEGISVVSKGTYRVRITAPRYGKWLDSMEPHLVSIRKSPMREWYQDKYNKKESSQKTLGAGGNEMHPGMIEVTPHPWIMDGLKFGRAKFEEMRQKHLSRYEKSREKREAIFKAKKEGKSLERTEVQDEGYDIGGEE